jgi:mitochondrial fission protein ELM1
MNKKFKVVVELSDHAITELLAISRRADTSVQQIIEDSVTNTIMNNRDISKTEENPKPRQSHAPEEFK